MKSGILIQTLALAIIVALAGTGCKKGSKGPTPIPGTKTSAPGGGGLVPPANPGDGRPARDPGFTDTNPIATKVPETTSGIAAADRETFEGMIADRAVFKANTVYFEFDKSSIKQSERTKIEEVAAYLKGTPANKLLIEGHCDERGTEEYNRALGERRSQSAREYLVKLGIGADRIRTISYGFDKPAVVGHDESAWSKNRRDEFILLKPPGTTN